MPPASSCIAYLHAVVRDCFHGRKFRVTCTTPAPGKSVTDYMKLRLVFPNPTVLSPQIRSDPLTAWTALPPCRCGGDGRCWASDEPGLEQKTKQCIPSNCCCDFILKYLILHIGFTCIANTLLLTCCILKSVFQLRRAQAGGYVGLSHAQALPVLPECASSVCGKDAQQQCPEARVDICPLYANKLVDF